MTEDPKELLRCTCGSPFDFTAIRKCAGCDRYICPNCAKPFRGRYFCKPCRKVHADAASRGIDLGEGGMAMTAAFPKVRVGDPNQSGVIPYRVANQGIEILLITSRRNGLWIVPKGMIEPELTALDSACKEAWEEAGVRGVAAPDPLGSYEYAKRGRTFDVSLYLLQVDSVAADWPECHARRREWMPLEKAAAAVENPGLRELIARVPAALAAGRRADESAEER